MTGPVRRFDPSEVRPASGPGPSDAELAEAMVAARELETLIARDAVGPTVGFEDRVMAAIATEPAPRLFGRPAASVRGGWPVAFVLSIRDAWRVATSGGRPVALRAQAMAFVLLVVLATGSISLFAVGASGLLDSSDGPTPTLPGPSPSVVPSPSATPSPSVVPSPSPSATPSPSPSESAEPTESAEATETAEPTETGDDSSGPGGGGGGGSSGPGGGNGGNDSSGPGGGDDDGADDNSSGPGGGD